MQLVGRARRAPLRRSVKVSLVVAVAWFALLGVLVLTLRLGVVELVALLLLNVLAVQMYTADKSAALAGRRRTPESSLLLVALLGGWPAALVTRHALRHKTVKEPFRTSFWCAVVAHCGVLAFWALLRPALPLPL